MDNVPGKEPFYLLFQERIVQMIFICCDNIKRLDLLEFQENVAEQLFTCPRNQTPTRMRMKSFPYSTQNNLCSRRLVFLRSKRKIFKIPYWNNENNWNRATPTQAYKFKKTVPDCYDSLSSPFDRSLIKIAFSHANVTFCSKYIVVNGIS